MISQEIIDGAIEHWSKRLSSVVVCDGHIEHCFLKIWLMGLASTFITQVP